ncbi:MAG: 3'(2'),5'-bisphosphate nucleotidase CysQ [Clostridiales bacterium]|nr:3'(2'),5'-bisphosphate nucleotidase CysQ [Clostridiales bacterium]
MYEKELKVAIELAVEAGKRILKIYNSDTYDITIKIDESPVTTADHMANELIVKGLYKEFPQYAILAEESIDNLERLNYESCWLVDPLDGTKEFIKHNDEFSVNIALVYKQRPVLGVIYNPVTEELYYAIENEGSFYEQTNKVLKEIAVSEKVDEIRALRSRSRISPKLTEMYDNEKKIKEVIKMGSSLKGCTIAKGEAEIYYSLGKTMEWDTAAMEIIVLEAGGVFKQLDDTVMLYNRRNSTNKGFYILNKVENKIQFKGE